MFFRASSTQVLIFLRLHTPLRLPLSDASISASPSATHAVPTAYRCMIPEKKHRWNSLRHRHETRTVWHPVVEFTVDGRKYHLQSPSNLIHSDLSVGEDVDIIYDADEPAHFDFEKVLEHDIRAAKIFIVVGLVWALFFTPFLVNKTLNE